MTNFADVYNSLDLGKKATSYRDWERDYRL